MENKKIVISLFGYSCTGKSMVADVIRDKYFGIYTIDYDKLKRQLSGYHRDKDASTIRKITHEFFEVICKNNKPILLLALPLKDELEYIAYQKIAKEYGYVFHFFEFTAPKEVLLERYRERLDSLEKKGIKDSIRTEGEYLDTFENKYFVPEHSVLFDTSKLSPEVIAEQILNTI